MPRPTLCKKIELQNESGQVYEVLYEAPFQSNTEPKPIRMKYLLSFDIPSLGHEHLDQVNLEGYTLCSSFSRERQRWFHRINT